jgi:hypothetical protein
MLLFLLIFGLGALAAIVFAGWVILTGARTLWRFVTGEVGTATQGSIATGDPRCRNGGCGTVNPVQARFCRRCGSSLGATVPMSPPRADRVQSTAMSAVR